MYIIINLEHNLYMHIYTICVTKKSTPLKHLFCVHLNNMHYIKPTQLCHNTVTPVCILKLTSKCHLKKIRIGFIQYMNWYMNMRYLKIILKTNEILQKIAYISKYIASWYKRRSSYL